MKFISIPTYLLFCSNLPNTNGILPLKQPNSQTDEYFLSLLITNFQVWDSASFPYLNLKKLSGGNNIQYSNLYFLINFFINLGKYLIKDKKVDNLREIIRD